MTPKQLDEFQAWLKHEADQANKGVEATYNQKRAYWEGRRCAFNDAFENLTINRMQASQPTESTEAAK